MGKATRGCGRGIFLSYLQKGLQEEGKDIHEYSAIQLQVKESQNGTCTTLVTEFLSMQKAQMAGDGTSRWWRAIGQKPKPPMLCHAWELMGILL